MGKISICAKHHQKILDLNRLRFSTLEISKELHLPEKALSGYMQRRKIYCLKTASERMREIDWDRVKHLIEVDLLTQDKVGELLGCDRTTVERVCRKMGLKTARTGPRSAAGHPEWKGGRVLDKHGYILVYAPLHPKARKGGHVAEHRLVMEVIIGRYLQENEVVDHLDNHPYHNWHGNLRVYSNNADHLKANLTGRKKPTPRSSIPGAYGSNQKIARCPSQLETLARCSEKIRRSVARHIQIHQPTKAHAHLSRSTILRSGPLENPFQSKSKG